MSRHLSTAAPAGCRAALWSSGGCWAAGGWSGRCWWRLAAACLSGGRRGKEGGPRRRGDGLPVVACLAAAGGLPGMDGAGNVPAAICGGDSAVFNQPLTIFLVVAIVWWLAVFFLCSYRQFRWCWRLFRSPGAWRWWAVSGVVWGGWLLDQGMGGVAEKGTVLLRMGVEYCPTSSRSLHGLWGGGKQAGGLSAILA